MDDRNTKQEIKRRVPLTRLIKPTARGSGAFPYKTRCFAHNDHDPSMSFNNTYCKCWACGFQGDIFDVIAFQNNLDVKRDFNEVMKIAKELAGMDTDSDKKSKTKRAPPKKRARVLTSEEGQ